jgi:hypothetical protein
VKLATFAVLASALVMVGCVDGATPDCTAIDSGCYPVETDSGPSDSGQSDVTDASSDGTPDASNDSAVDSAVDSADD